ncbi:Serine--glyoxylate aminotransferase [Usitatibacter rugosus]|uniref:Serine--glyoxylate aminotransferase n=1 Tax=Usitatibacter rugosus TaxID=2732067 RepID=A0A6M4GXT2_9PROT|nr:aminotransferase class V-fold PLP-dependent enzyme [Usitatibacter rugosus]QJR12066.1 Serine--glyoxylate aminotransferase [Usitatibacter rugosus]
MTVARGWQFFMHPGPTNIPHRVLQAMARPTVDFTAPEFVALRDRSLQRMKGILKTREGFVIMYAASGNGAWDASIANLFSPGDKVLVPQTGFFADRWSNTARAYGLEVEALPTPDRRPVDPEAVGRALAADTKHQIKAVMLIQNETATGIRHPIAEVRAVMNRLGHPALYLVDTISSLASYDFRMDEWGVDLVIGGSQKGLMLPPGMAFTAINPRAWAVAQTTTNTRKYWDWRPMIENGRQVQFCGTPPISHFFGLEASLDMLEEEGLENVFVRHRRLADATRACVRHWGKSGGVEIYSLDPDFASDSLTAVMVPAGHDADRVRAIAQDRYGVALGRGLGVLQGKIFRIGHMGDLNEPMVLGALAAIELALAEAGIPHASGGVEAAMDSLRAPAAARRAAVAA